MASLIYGCYRSCSCCWPNEYESLDSSSARNYNTNNNNDNNNGNDGNRRRVNNSDIAIIEDRCENCKKQFRWYNSRYSCVNCERFLCVNCFTGKKHRFYNANVFQIAPDSLNFECIDCYEDEEKFVKFKDIYEPFLRKGVDCVVQGLYGRSLKITLRVVDDLCTVVKWESSEIFTYVKENVVENNGNVPKEQEQQQQKQQQQQQKPQQQGEEEEEEEEEEEREEEEKLEKKKKKKGKMIRKKVPKFTGEFNVHSVVDITLGTTALQGRNDLDPTMLLEIEFQNASQSGFNTNFFEINKKLCLYFESSASKTRFMEAIEAAQQQDLRKHESVLERAKRTRNERLAAIRAAKAKKTSKFKKFGNKILSKFKRRKNNNNNNNNNSSIPAEEDIEDADVDDDDNDDDNDNDDNDDNDDDNDDNDDVNENNGGSNSSRNNNNNNNNN